VILAMSSIRVGPSPSTGQPAPIHKPLGLSGAGEGGPFGKAFSPLRLVSTQPYSNRFLFSLWGRHWELLESLFGK